MKLNALFENLSKDRKLRHDATRFINQQKNLENSDCEQLLFLQLYYSTHLTGNQVLDLDYSAAANLLSESERHNLPHLLRQQLNRNLNNMKKQQRLFSQDFINEVNADPYSFMRQGLDRRFVSRLRANRVLCSSDEFKVLPTPLRLNSDPRYSGKGICIAFLDGGFYPHPDIMRPHRRVVAYKDLASPYRPKSDFEKPDVMSWHGMQTCVSAVGNGYLSKGLYKGIAHDANVALLKVCGDFGFTSEAIVQAIEWCIRKKKRYNLRVINISLGTEGEGSFRESVINHAAEEAVQAGINVVVAAGNDSHASITPPGNSPSVITVGGLDDRNSLNKDDHGMYHSSYGRTADGIMKPELIAPGIWVAAPTLPGTAFYREAETLWELANNVADNEFMDQFNAFKAVIPWSDQVNYLKPYEIRQAIHRKLREYKLVSPYYQHVDGTSFSAPIICSIIAQMLEVNPDLSPGNVKGILMETAERISNIPVEAQGCGVVQARAAVEAAKKRISSNGFEYPNVNDNVATLSYSGDVNSVEVLGSFNNWQLGQHKMRKNRSGDRSIKIELPEMGTYTYKFLIDGEHWIDDPQNAERIYDGYGGFNSVLHIYGSPRTRETLKKLEAELSSIKSVKFENKQHRLILEQIDDLFQGESVSKSPQVQGFYERRMKRVVDNLRDRQVSDGIFLHQLYNCGFVIQTPSMNFGMDVVSTSHVWELFWKIDPNVFHELSDLLDMAFVSHRLPDHLDLEVVNRMIGSDKLVAVPSGMENLCINGVIGFESGEVRDLYSLGRGNIPVNIEALDLPFRMRHTTDLDMRAYKVSILEKLSLLHVGELDYEACVNSPEIRNLLKSLSPLDILLAPLPMVSGRSEQAFFDFIELVAPDIIVPMHLAELGQKDPKMRGSYRRAYELLDRTGREFAVLGWGDSVKIANLDD